VSTSEDSVGKYHLLASLGRGGMADVFLATAGGPHGFSKLAVIKRLRTHLTEDAAVLGMFLDEARLAARLNHPNVIHTYEVGEHEGRYFIVMEYLDGQPLNRIVHRAVTRSGMLSSSIVVRVVIDALTGLHYAHELRDYDDAPIHLVHRDISPHNVFVTYEGQVKVVDFGIAKAALSRTQTEVGTLKGKVAYMAPEQAMGRDVDRRSDLFSMGTLLWESLTGRRLFSGETAAASLNRVFHATIPAPSSLASGIDSGLDAIVAKALERDRANRFQSAQEMRQALVAWGRGPGRIAEQEEVGRLVSELFQDVRQTVHAQIRAHMDLRTKQAHFQGTRALAHTATGLPAIRVDGDPDSERQGGSGASDVRRSVGSSTAPITVSAYAGSDKRRALLLGGLGLGGLLFVLLLVVALVRSPDSGATSTQSGAASAATDPGAVALPVTATTTTPPASSPSPEPLAAAPTTPAAPTAPAAPGPPRVRYWLPQRPSAASGPGSGRAQAGAGSSPESASPQGPSPVLAPPPKPTVRSLDTSDPWARP
jgi:serine/threonine-protein kinase